MYLRGCDYSHTSQQENLNQVEQETRLAAIELKRRKIIVCDKQEPQAFFPREIQTTMVVIGLTQKSCGRF